jgi:hypothetical protein
MNSTEFTPEKDQPTENHDRRDGGHDRDEYRGERGHHPRGPRGAGFGRRGFGQGAGPTIVIQNGLPQGFGPGAGFGPHGFGPGHRPQHPGFGPFAGARPKKGDIRLMKRVRSIAVELGKYRGTASKEQRAQALAALDDTIVEIKRILAS